MDDLYDYLMRFCFQQHRDDSFHHVNAKAEFTYTLKFSIPTEVKYLRAFGNGEGYLVAHNDIEAYMPKEAGKPAAPKPRTLKTEPRFKRGAKVITKVPISLGEGSVLIPKGSMLRIQAEGTSTTGHLGDKKHVSYEIALYVTETHNVQYVSSYMLPSQFALDA
ncbi:hypothetical protein BDN70DRAFT_989829 [Pholiota conissans]|uniref:Uncharacterized protein n=1 Tax=Pholiota conissans TaxID=109636 RepID=A0A9P6D623_9AGAR|nr:hypothetical protein BDN70DRAFT_989829 [Pholiota conissans]